MIGVHIQQNHVVEFQPFRGTNIRDLDARSEREVLVIDEVSMIDGKLFTALAAIGRAVRGRGRCLGREPAR